MSYQKQHFVPEQFLSAAELNHIEEGIELNRTLARNFEAAHIETLFKNSEVEPDRIIGGNTSGWSEVQSAPSANEHTYLILRISSNNNWSKPIKISSKSYSGGGSGTPDGGDGSVEGGGSSGDIGAEFEEQLEEIRTELNNQLEELNTKLEEAKNKVDNLSERADNLSELAGDLSDHAAEQKEQFDQLSQEMTPLVEWSDGTNSGAAGFIAKADQNSAQLADIVTWQGTTNESIAGISRQASANEALITTLAALQGEHSETIATIQQKATEQEASISMLTEWKGTVENGDSGDTTTAIAAINVKVDGLSSQITSLTTLQNEHSESIAGIEQKATATEASITQLTEWKNAADESIKTIAGIEQKANENEASITSLTEWQGTTNESITSIEQKATEQEASISTLTSWKSDNEKAIQSIAGIEQTVDAHESKIATLTSWKDSASSSLATIQQTATEQGASIKSLTEWKSSVENGESGDVNTAIAAINQTVSDLSAEVSQLAGYTTENSEALSAYKNEARENFASNTELASVRTGAAEALATYKAEVTDTYATKTDIVSFVTEDELTGKLNESKAEITQSVSESYATIGAVAQVETSTTKALSDYKTEVGATYATTSALNSLKTDTANALTEYKAEVSENYAKTTDLVSYATKEDLNTSTAAINKNVSENKAAIDLVVDNGTVKAAILVDAINSQSTATINADKINLNGNATFTSAVKAANDAAEAANNAATATNNAVKSVQYFYLSTNSPTTAPSENNNGWKATADEWQSGKYLWQKIVVTKGDGTVANSISCLSGAEGAAGAPGVSLQVRYINSATPPVISNNDVTGWSTTIPNPEDDKATYMTQKLSSELDWSIPVQITGQKGEPGKDGESVEFVYYRSNSATTPDTPTDTITAAPPKNNTWTVSPSGITEDYKYEYMSMRIKSSGIDQSWGAYSTPVLWSKWGEKGQNGDGVTYMYQVAELPPHLYSPSGTWYTAPQDMSEKYAFEYVKAVTCYGDGTTQESKPTLWATYSKDGKNGEAAPKITAAKTQYTFTSSDKTAPGASATWGYDDVPTNWTSSDPVCVWTRDEFTFDNGSVIYTEPVFNQSYSNIANWCDAADRTLINGANIATGSITAAQIAAGSITANEIDATNLQVDAANIKGTLTASQINGEGLKISSSDSTSKITLEKGKLQMAKAKSSSGNGYLCYDGTDITLMGDAIPLYLFSSEHILLSTNNQIRLSATGGDVIQEARGKIILCPSEYTSTETNSHKLNLEWDSTNSRLLLIPENKMVISSENNFAVQAPNIYLGQTGTTQGQLSGTWKLNSGTLTTSAREAKNSIEDIDNRYSVLFDNLKPCRFKYNDGTSDRYHTGLIVDELKDAMDIAEIDSSEFAAYCLDENGGGIRYGELIALLIKEVQSLKKQVAELKSPTE